MKAIVCRRYGSPEAVRCQEVDTPVPRPHEALVRIHSSSLNAADLESLRGTLLVRFGAPFRPAFRIPGSDFAGTVESVGEMVGACTPGDAVWGDLSYPLNFGGFAEYVCVPETSIRLKPPGMTFDQAAATPSAACVALQNLRAAAPDGAGILLSDTGTLHPGQRVLINGAGGGVGTFAVQIAKSMGAEVTAVDIAPKLRVLRDLGADHVLDSDKTDYTRSGNRYDLILDVVARRSIFAYRRALAPAGVFDYVGGSTPAILQSFLLGPLLSMLGRRKFGFAMWKPNDAEDLAEIAFLHNSGKIAPVIDRCFPLSEVAAALEYLERGLAIGKVVIHCTRTDGS